MRLMILMAAALSLMACDDSQPTRAAQEGADA
ncbi:MAG: hypothetical protein ACI9U2_003984, partial [Bradymonadia bacterium]